MILATLTENAEKPPVAPDALIMDLILHTHYRIDRALTASQANLRRALTLSIGKALSLEGHPSAVFYNMKAPIAQQGHIDGARTQLKLPSREDLLTPGKLFPANQLLRVCETSLILSAITTDEKQEIDTLKALDAYAYEIPFLYIRRLPLTNLPVGLPTQETVAEEPARKDTPAELDK